MFDKVYSLIVPFFRSENYLRGSALQERADLLRLFLLVKAHETWPEVSVKTLDQIRELAPNAKNLRESVSAHVQRSTLTHLKRWLTERPPPLDPLDPEKPLPEQRREEVETQYKNKLSEAQKRAFGFALRVAPSQVGSNGGNGVFIDGTASPGSVVVLYPGIWYEPQHMYQLPGGIEFFKVSSPTKPEPPPALDALSDSQPAV